MSVEFKYQIFISSPYKELRDCRKALISTILRTGHIPSGMEDFNAGDVEDLKVIENAIIQCDIFVVMLGSEFGSVIPGTSPPESFTQRELRIAREHNKPILAFIRLDDEVNARRNLFENNHPERQHDKAYTAFRDELKTYRDDPSRHRIVGYFGMDSGTQALEAIFASSLNALVSRPDFQAAGWMKLPPHVGTNPFIRTIIDKLSSFDAISYRCTAESPDVKEAMAKCFWANCEFNIINYNKRRLFIESGSTLAFVAEELRGLIRKPHWEDFVNKCELRTNNVLTFLEMILCDPMKTSLFPHGPPDSEDKYGATFGPFLKCVPRNFPQEPEPLCTTDPNAYRVVKVVAESLSEHPASTMILATASGLEANSGMFPGPHVGTYHNKLVKRAMLESKVPLVLFLDSQKILPHGTKSKFNPGKCHHVCDMHLSWEMVTSTQPIAMCFGADNLDELEKVEAEVDKHGKWTWKSPVFIRDGKECARLVANSQWQEVFHSNGDEACVTPLGQVQ